MSRSKHTEAKMIGAVKQMEAGRKKRKHCARLSTPLGIYTAANQEWALDFGAP